MLLASIQLIRLLNTVRSPAESRDIRSPLRLHVIVLTLGKTDVVVDEDQ